MVLSVPDMTCGHCKASVEAALAPLATQVVVDLAKGQVTVEGSDDPARVLYALEGVGFPARVIG
ncbi:MAG: heavy-metal-associated domain-containing protein [Rhodobacteraceae bacterium]|nr:heavy-metal-associated domain-containing protein [Paracoccaceae bacterium]